MTADDVLALARPIHILGRAFSAPKRGIKYQLGRGGRNPLSPTPADAQGRCDCSGFAAWCCGLDRYQPRSALLKKWNGGWISTDAIVYDAGKPRALSGFFTRVEEPVPGDLVVYGDKGKAQGHVGIVSAVSVDIWPIRVIDCSSSNYRRTGDAIQERDGTFFRAKNSIFVRFDP